MKALNVITECYVDTNLVETLLPANFDACNHQKGCSTVLKRLAALPAQEVALGIIDEDKNKPAQLSEYQLVASTSNLRLLAKPGTNHFVLELQGVVERFILQECRVANIRTEDYHLPSDLSALVLITKVKTSQKDQRLRALFKALKLAAPNGIGQLQYWLAVFAKGGYAIDGEALRKGS